MEDVTEKARQGNLALKSAQTATLFPNRSRDYRTGVKVEDVSALQFKDTGVEGLRVFELSADPATGEILALLVNSTSGSMMVSEGDLLAHVSLGKEVVAPEVVADIIKADWEVVGRSGDQPTIVDEAVSDADLEVEPVSDREPTLEQAPDDAVE